MTAPIWASGKDDLITIPQAATMCGVTTQAIHMWIKRGKLTVAGLGEDDETKLVRVLDVARAERSTRDHPAARRQPPQV